MHHIGNGLRSEKTERVVERENGRDYLIFVFLNYYNRSLDVARHSLSSFPVPRCHVGVGPGSGVLIELQNVGAWWHGLMRTVGIVDGMFNEKKKLTWL